MSTNFLSYFNILTEDKLRNIYVLTIVADSFFAVDSWMSSKHKKCVKTNGGDNQIAEASQSKDVG